MVNEKRLNLEPWDMPSLNAEGYRRNQNRRNQSWKKIMCVVIWKPSEKIELRRRECSQENGTTELTIDLAGCGLLKWNGYLVNQTEMGLGEDGTRKIGNSEERPMFGRFSCKRAERNDRSIMFFRFFTFIRHLTISHFIT